MKQIIIILALVAIIPRYSDGAAKIKKSLAPLDLQTAIERVTAHHPALSIAEADVMATRAEALQAGLWVNPVFGAEAENVLGSGDFSGGESAEYTFSVSQTFELGGKRSKRKEAALLREKVAEWNLAGRRLAIEQITIRAFYTALAMESRLTLAIKQVELAGKVVKKAEHRVNAGRAHKLEVSKAQLELADVELDAENMKQALVAAKTTLAALWQGSASDIGILKGNSEEIMPPISITEITARLKKHPVILQAEAEIRQQQAAENMEQSMRIPNVDVGAGIRLLEENGDQAFVFGLSIPLPFADRNQGNREAAHIRTLQAEDQLTATQLELYQTLLDKSIEVQMAYIQVVKLKKNQLPIAETAFKQATDGYEKGLFGSLDLLDAMRGLFEQEKRYINALLNYQQSRTILENMISTNIENK